MYFEKLLAAFVRGRLPLVASLPISAADERLWLDPLENLDPSGYARLSEVGSAAGLKIHKFKRTMGLARVSKVLGILRGIQPVSLLDIGSGRGVFLWPLLDAFPLLTVTCADINEQRVSDINAVSRGGISNLAACTADAAALPFSEGEFDVVTALEVLEHMPRPLDAIAEMVRVARRFVVASVPSHEDDNPEHIHLFDARTLPAMFSQAGAKSVRVDYVHNHMILVASLSNSGDA